MSGAASWQRCAPEPHRPCVRFDDDANDRAGATHYLRERAYQTLIEEELLRGYCIRSSGRRIRLDQWSRASYQKLCGEPR